MSRPYDVLITTAGMRDFERLPPDVRDRIRETMLSLADEPRRRAQKLAGSDAYRIRVGVYRIVFRVDDDVREVLVARIKHRRDAYRR